jgi:hypothetical protein
LQFLAVCAGEDLCDESENAAAALVSDFMRLAERPEESVQRHAIRGLAAMGAAGAACLQQLRNHPTQSIRECARIVLKAHAHRFPQARPQHGILRRLADWLSMLMKRSP